MEKKLVIFDLDGTLLDTIADLAAATNAALSAFGFPTHSNSTIRTFVGNGISKLLERSLPEEKRNEENVALLRTVFFPYYDAHNAELTSPYPGITDMLSLLNHKGLKLAIASNKYQLATENLVSHFFPEIPFVAVLGQRTDVPIKPNPQIIYDIMSTADVIPEEVLYVGDSGVDMQTGFNAGIDTIAVSWGFRSRTELETYNPMAIIDHPSQLMQFIP